MGVTPHRRRRMGTAASLNSPLVVDPKTAQLQGRHAVVRAVRDASLPQARSTGTSRSRPGRIPGRWTSAQAVDANWGR